MSVKAQTELLTDGGSSSEEQGKMEVYLSRPTGAKGHRSLDRKIGSTFPETEFDGLAQLAADICQTPIAAISLIEGKQQLIKSKIGLETNQLQNCLAFGDYTLDHSDLLVIPDTWKDKRVASNPLVTTYPQIRLYAGMPIVTPEGITLGTLGVMDHLPGYLTSKQQRSLKTLARQLAVLIRLHHQHQTSDLMQLNKMPLEESWNITDIFENITDAFLALDDQWRFTYLNSRAEQILLKSRDELIGQCLWKEFPNLVGSTFQQECQRALSKGVTVHFEEFYLPLGIWLEIRSYPYPGGLLVYFRDVTMRKQSEAMLMERSHLSALAAEIGITLADGGAISELLTHCTQIMMEHLDLGHACIWTMNLESSRLEIQAIAFSPDWNIPADNNNTNLAGQCCPTAPSCNLNPPDGSIVDWMIQNRQPYLANDLTQDPLGIKDWLKQTGACCAVPIQAFSAYPLIVEERLIGFITLSFRQSLTKDCHHTLEWVTNAIAVAIDRAWARAELLSRRESLLFRLASQIRNSLDLDMILATAVNEIRTLLHIDRCHFLWCWPHPEQPSLTVTHEACVANMPSILGEYPSEEVSSLVQTILNLETLRVDNIQNATNLDPQTQAMLSNLGITSQLLLPLETHSGQLGAVVCSHCGGPRPWSNSEVELLQAVVDQVAIAIDQAELYAQTRAAAFAAQAQAQQLSDALNNLKQTEAHLVHTEKMSSLGQMVAGIAHEINNPVNFIYGNLTYAADYIQDLLRLLQLYQQYYPEPVKEIQQEADNIDLEFLKDDLPKLLTSMQVGTERIRQIVLSLRNFSRLDESEKKPVNMHEGIDNTLLILHNRIKANASRPEIQIIKEYTQLPQIECYAGQLNQVFMNIVSNAIDALENQSEPRIITIRTEILNHPFSISPTEDNLSPSSAESLPSHQFVVIRVRDNGPGMTEEVRKHLFDPFFTTKPVGKGTGLGLSISYQIVVEKHGGRLQCFSTPGEGAEFVIEIPIPTF